MQTARGGEQQKGYEISPEFSFLLDCCSWNFRNGDGATLDIPTQMDWPAFVELARFHRVQGLVWNALAPSAASMPLAAADSFASAARLIAGTNLAIAMECRDLLDIFRRASLPLLFVKGLTVGALAYRSPMLKMGWDIDLLIDANDLSQAAELLCGHGYLPSLPPELAQLRSWHVRSKESIWNRDGRFHVELHSRLADNLQLIPKIVVHSPKQDVEILPGIALKTLARDELFAYLCVHGASSAWFRLKWITDFAGFLYGTASAEIERLYTRSQELGAERAAGQALLLADRLYGTLAGTELKDRLAGDPANRILANAALRQLAGRAEPVEPTATPLGTARIHWTQLLLKPGLGFKLRELLRQSGDAIGWR